MNTLATTEAVEIDLEKSLSPKPYYHVHFFVCVNRRNNSRSCAGGGSEHLQEYVKKRARLALPESCRVRINKSGCLGRCEHGPVAVIYPDGVWYRYRSKEDLDEILSEHIVHGRIVQRLVVPETEDAA
jgi:(2Fe-2S) ferredoxin